MSPFRRALDDEFDLLPQAVRDLHVGSEAKRYEGVANVEHGPGPLAALARALGRFPAAGTNLPFALSVTPDRDKEHWVRRFGSHLTASSLQFDRDTRKVIERFGPLSCVMALRVEGGALTVSVEKAACLGLPLPALLTPVSQAREWGQERVCFDIGARFAFGGLIIRYHGWLDPVLPDAP